jgi:hypothetical protein
MTHNIFVAGKPLEPGALVKRMIIGGAIGLALMALFLLPIKHPHAGWGPYWMVRPFVMIAFAGAVGGAFSYLMNAVFEGTAAKKAFGIALSLVVYLIGLWMGTVLGLVGTLWH